MRILKERAGVNAVSYLEEFAVFGRKNRSEGYFEDFDETLSINRDSLQLVIMLYTIPLKLVWPRTSSVRVVNGFI